MVNVPLKVSFEPSKRMTFLPLIPLEINSGLFVASGTGTTGTGGTVTFQLSNAASGCYETQVTDVTADGLTWDANDPGNTSEQFCK